MAKTDYCKDCPGPKALIDTDRCEGQRAVMWTAIKKKMSVGVFLTILIPFAVVVLGWNGYTGDKLITVIEITHENAEKTRKLLSEFQHNFDLEKVRRDHAFEKIITRIEQTESRLQKIGRSTEPQWATGGE